jgi:fido (protein-threonine AMPylation protein)
VAGHQGSTWPELVFADQADSAVLTRAVQRGTIRRLVRGIYASDLTASPEAIVRRHLWRILAHEFPGAIIADRSVHTGGMPVGGALYVVHSRRRPLDLPGVTIRPRQGSGAVHGDTPLPDGLWMSSTQRALLDNLATGQDAERRLTRREVEEWIERLLQQRGEDGLNALRDGARSIAAELGRAAQLRVLDALISAALATHSDEELVSPGLRARAAGVPFDEERVKAFAKLAAELQDTPPDSVPDLPVDASRRRLLPFYEAYFSNYIEGTEFTLDEAAEIVFGHRMPESRPQDAHDVLGTYEIVSDAVEMATVPRTADGLIELLRARHAVLFGSRQEKHPGVFKTRANRAGLTEFVAPGLVEGTLRRGFDIAGGLVEPFARAVYLMFLVAEVHPFDDGNGRVARIMMNAELVAEREVRIIIPIVYRGNYLSALKGASHNGSYRAMIRMLSFARRYSARIDFGSRESAEADLDRTNAFRDALEAETSGVRLVLP